MDAAQPLVKRVMPLNLEAPLTPPFVPVEVFITHSAIQPSFCMPSPTRLVVAVNTAESPTESDLTMLYFHELYHCYQWYRLIWTPPTRTTEFANTSTLLAFMQQMGMQDTDFAEMFRTAMHNQEWYDSKLSEIPWLLEGAAMLSSIMFTHYFRNQTYSTLDAMSLADFLKDTNYTALRSPESYATRTAQQSYKIYTVMALLMVNITSYRKVIHDYWVTRDFGGTFGIEEAEFYDRIRGIEAENVQPLYDLHDPVAELRAAFPYSLA